MPGGEQWRTGGQWLSVELLSLTTGSQWQCGPAWRHDGDQWDHCHHVRTVKHDQSCPVVCGIYTESFTSTMTTHLSSRSEQAGQEHRGWQSRLLTLSTSSFSISNSRCTAERSPLITLMKNSLPSQWELLDRSLFTVPLLIPTTQC